MANFGAMVFPPQAAWIEDRTSIKCPKADGDIIWLDDNPEDMDAGEVDAGDDHPPTESSEDREENTDKHYKTFSGKRFLPG